MKGWCAKITEGRTRIEITNGGGINTSETFDIDENQNEEIDFI